MTMVITTAAELKREMKCCRQNYNKNAETIETSLYIHMYISTYMHLYIFVACRILCSIGDLGVIKASNPKQSIANTTMTNE